MNDQKAIVVEDLQKSFGDLQAVRGVSFEVGRGEILALLGPNGAGKSTTISMLACLLAPDGGDARVMGHSIRKEVMGVKEAIGLVPQEIALYEDLPARDNLDFWGKMYGLRGEALARRVDEVLALIGLTERQKDKVGKYSGGMKRRLNIGVALLHKPPVLILDEPTVGIDPQSRRNILDGVKDLNREGMTVLYTTHYMEEAQELADRIAIMDQGQVIAYGAHEELVQIVGELDRLDLVLSAAPGRELDLEPLLARWRAVDGVHQVFLPQPEELAEGAGAGTPAAAPLEGTHVTLLVVDSNVALPPIFETAVDAGTRITSVQIQEPNLETVFLHLTGRALRD
ncbi:MAG: ABC transporter ATP-binding protein [Anaerolineae bacterium]|nr:ABC transporter ATP-binding protein [Anaerolineae bacterium]